MYLLPITLFLVERLVILVYTRMQAVDPLSKQSFCRRRCKANHLCSLF